MTAERIWLLVNKRRADRRREPVTLARVQRALRIMLPCSTRPQRSPLWHAAPAPNGGRPPFRRYGPR